MRISRDRDSWKARGILRRDFRHSHDGPEAAPHRSKPKPKQWCRGIEGRLHVPVFVLRTFCDQTVCDACGKVLAWHWRPWR